MFSAFISSTDMTVSNYDIGYGNGFLRLSEHKKSTISDGREIYNNINLNSYIQQDPIATKINKINELKIERQQLLIQLEVLKNG